MSVTFEPFSKAEARMPARDPGPDLAARKPPSRGVRCRQITANDADAVIDLLCEGFARLPRRHWIAAFDILHARAVPEAMPRYGYMIESDGRPVGVLLVLAAELHRGGGKTLRCNGSAWYVRPAFRGYGPFLLDRSLRLPSDIYFNVFPAPHTFSLIEARGFTRFTNGISLSVPAAVVRMGRVRILDAGRLAEATRPIPPEDHDLLLDHARAGCIAVWCETRDGGYPFVFRRRLIKSRLPCAQLIYCHDLEDFSRLAGPVGRYLLRRGMPVVLAAANGPVPGIPGIYIDDKYPMYARGDVPPRVGDLAYTEAALFGF